MPINRFTKSIMATIPSEELVIQNSKVWDAAAKATLTLRVNPDYLMQDDLSLNPYEEKMRLLTPSPSYRLKAISCLKILLNRSVIRIEKDRGRSSWIKNI